MTERTWPVHTFDVDTSKLDAFLDVDDERLATPEQAVELLCNLNAVAAHALWDDCTFPADCFCRDRTPEQRANFLHDGTTLRFIIEATRQALLDRGRR